MLWAILNKSWRQHPTRHQLYGLLPPITKTIQVRWTRHAGHCWRSRDELKNDVLLWTPHMAGQKYEHTFSSYVRIRGVALKTCQRRWTIGKSGERGSVCVRERERESGGEGERDMNILGLIYRLIWIDCYIYIYIYSVRERVCVCMRERERWGERERENEGGKGREIWTYLDWYIDWYE